MSLTPASDSVPRLSLPPHPSHRRYILFISDNYGLLIFSIQGATEHDIASSLSFLLCSRLPSVRPSIHLSLHLSFLSHGSPSFTSPSFPPPHGCFFFEKVSSRLWLRLIRLGRGLEIGQISHPNGTWAPRSNPDSESWLVYQPARFFSRENNQNVGFSRVCTTCFSSVYRSGCKSRSTRSTKSQCCLTLSL